MTWKYLCNADDVEKDTLKLVDLEDGMSVAVTNYGSGFRAIPPVCPHMAEPLDVSGVISNCVMTCTKHLWSWNLETLEQVNGEDEMAILSYKTKEEDGKLFAWIEQELVYDHDESEDDMDDDDFFG